MSSLIQIKNTAISGSVPANLTQGELAINVTNGRLFYGSGSNNVVKEFTGSASGGGGTINTGSLLTTASFNAWTGSSTSRFFGTASFAQTASFVVSSSYAISSSNALTASYVLQAISASYATTASFAITSSRATTASYALNGGVTQLLAGSNISLSPTTGVGQVTISSTGGGGGSNTATGSYGSFYDTTTQTNVAGTARSMSLNTTDISNGVSVSGSTNPFNTYIKTENAGVYDIQFSAQVDKTDSGTDEIWIWLRKNGTNLTDTATSIQLVGNGAHYVAAWNFFVNAAANDYFQLMWYSPDANVRLHAESAFGVVPGIPSLIVTANRVDQFLSNTGSFSGSFTGQFTGSLFGTSSWATNALTSSYLNGGTNGFIQNGNSFGAQAVLGTNDNQSLALETSGSTRMFISSSGNVGIGTTSSSYKLTIAQDGYNLRLANTPNSQGYNIGRNISDGILYFYGEQSGFNGYAFTGINGERMRVATSGNILINTTTDAGFKLDISGSARITNGLTVTGSTLLTNGQTTIRGAGATSATTSFLVQNSTPSTLFSVLDSGNTGIGLAAPSASLHISGASSAALLEIDSPAVNNILFVSGSGRVGIGTSNPTTTLDVSGSARITNQLTLSNYTNSGSFPGTGSAMLAVNNSGSVITSPFLDVAEQVYTGSIAWTGTAAPSGSTTHTYRWSQVGKTVNLNIVLNYTGPGNAVSTVTTALPADCPTPYISSGQSGAGALISVVSAHLTTTNTIGANIARGGLRINPTNNGYELSATATAAGYKTLVTSVQYFAV